MSDWSGSLVLGTGIAVYVGTGTGAAPHRHSAVQVIGTSGQAMQLTVEDDEFTARLTIVPADLVHSFTAPDGDIVVTLIEPTGVFGRAVNSFAHDRRATDLHDPGVPLSPVPADPHDRVEWARAAVGSLVRSPDLSRPAVCRPEVIDAARLVADGRESVPRLTDVARRVGLSPRQLSRSFTEQIGMPFRRFVVWTRIRRAVLGVRDGQDLTRAAADAGFADSAHFSRVFLAMFGLQPSVVLPFIEVVDTDTPST